MTANQIAINRTTFLELKNIIMNVRNNVQLIGNLGKDVEIKKFDSGKIKAKISLATSDFYKNDKGEKVQETEWHNIVAWGKVAENMNTILSKGSEVLIKGKIQSRSYKDKEDNAKYITEIVASDFLCFDKKAAPF